MKFSLKSESRCWRYCPAVDCSCYVEWFTAISSRWSLTSSLHVHLHSHAHIHIQAYICPHNVSEKSLQLKEIPGRDLVLLPIIALNGGHQSSTGIPGFFFCFVKEQPLFLLISNQFGECLLCRYYFQFSERGENRMNFQNPQSSDSTKKEPEVESCI